MRRAAVVVACLLAGALSAHTVDPREVIDYLNAPQTREACGINRAVQVDGRPDLLLIEVGKAWFRLPADRRQHLAVEWRDLWRHSVRSGRVSVIDAGSRPVVHYLPDGGAAVVDEK